MTARRRSLLIAIAATFGALLLFLAAAPWLFAGPIERRARVAVNDQVEAHVDWTRARVSVLRNFPNVTLRLDDLSVVGVAPFEGDTLLSLQRFRLVLDAGSVVRALRGNGALVVRQVALQRPDVRLRVLADGTANWNILRAEPDTTPQDTSAAMAFSLRSLTIEDGAFSLDDRQAGLQARVDGLQQTLRGDFSQERFTVTTQTEADAVSVRFAGVPYLTRVRLALQADVDADTRSSTYTFRDNEVRLNALVLAFAGTVTQGERLGLDISFRTPSTQFGDILSLVPAVYARDFASVQTSGTMSVSGEVRGEYGPDAFPALALRASVENGTFRYPDLPLPARDIFLDLAVDNPGGHVDSTVVSLRRFHVVMGSRPIDASLTMRTPVSDPDVDLRARGSLDLADVGRTVKLDGVDELRGLLSANIATRARQSDVDAGRYDRIRADGTFDVVRFALRSDAMPHPMMIDTAALRLTPRHAELSAFRGTIGSSDLEATGALDNLLGFALRDEVLRGRASLTSRYLDLDEWRSDDETTEVIPVPSNIDFAMQAAVARMKFGDLEMTDARGGVRVKDQRVTLEGFRMAMLGGTVTATGHYETTDVARPTFDMDLRVERVDIPGAFAAVNTVRMLAPVARYARGNFSSELRMAGAMNADMTPAYDVLTGRGSFETAEVAIQDFPPLDRLADVLKVDQLRDPAMRAIRSTLEIRDGRLHVSPFDVRIGDSEMRVAGSNGIDQSLDYTLALRLPTAMLGADANRAVANLAAQSARAGIDIPAAEFVALGVQIGGTVTSPQVRANFSDAIGSTRAGLEQAARSEVDRRLEDAGRQVDAAAEEARRRAREEADRLVAEAEERAAVIRAEARTLAETIRREGREQADALVERAANPVARVAAETAANRLRRESDERADRVVREADARADGLVEEARRRGDDLVARVQ